MPMTNLELWKLSDAVCHLQQRAKLRNLSCNSSMIRKSSRLSTDALTRLQYQPKH